MLKPSQAAVLRDSQWREGRARHAPRVHALVWALVAWSLAAWPQAAWAWGRDGHRAAARVTESRLTPAARAAVKALLDEGESLADASTWADDHRREMPETSPWHYVNVRITQPRYDEATLRPQDGQLVAKIDELKRTLADRNASRTDRQRALRFVVHLVQDLHQPVHVGCRFEGDKSDRGGNDLQLQFFGKGTNLHRIWDFEVIEHAGLDEKALSGELTKLTQTPEAASWSRGTTTDWANESLENARLAYRPTGSKRELRAGDKLGQPYSDFALPIIRLRLAQSAVRLASLLNEALA